MKLRNSKLGSEISEDINEGDIKNEMSGWEKGLKEIILSEDQNICWNYL